MKITLKGSGYALLMLSLALCLAACGDSENPDEITFDRSSLLESLANDLILPNFEDLRSSVDDLATATESFTNSSTEANLLALRAAWTEAVEDFQHTSAFGFGPAELNLGPFAEVLAVFPVNETGVEANLQNPDFNLPASFDRDIRGFYAVEYLIFRQNMTDQAVVASFDQSRIAYLNLLVDELKSTVDSIVTAWRGSYFDEFVSNDGTAAGSSISLLYNAWIKDYENLKNFKVELPAGLTAGQQAADPALVEAYYSGIGRGLIFNHFESSKNVWFGRSKTGANLVGFQEYLQAIAGGAELVEATQRAIGDIDSAIAALPQGRFSDHVETTEVSTLRTLLQNNTANFKSSMSSLLGISITFNSGDGD